MRARQTLWKTETELAASVVLWLRANGWEVYQEVQLHGPVCDLVAVRGPLVWAIETKLHFGVTVIEQATEWLRHANLVSVATPPARSSAVLTEYCRWKGIGWLHVTCPSWGEVNPDCTHERTAPAVHRRTSGKLRAALRDEHKTACPAGSNRGGYLTPFKETCRRVAEVVTKRPGITLKELVDELTTTHYASKGSARAGIAHWTEQGKVPGVRLDRTGKPLRLFPSLHESWGYSKGDPTLLPMIDLKLIRTLSVDGFSPDPDPNVTPPADEDTFTVPELNQRAVGHCLKFTYRGDAGAYIDDGSVSFTTWYKDKVGDGGWTRLAPEAEAPTNTSFVSKVVAKIFVQLNSLDNPGLAETLQIWAGPRTSV